MTNRLQVGIDFSQKRADLCLLFPDGELLEAHQPFWNSIVGYQQAKQWLLQVLEQYGFDGLTVGAAAMMGFSQNSQLPTG